jgi:hypothetical protein
VNRILDMFTIFWDGVGVKMVLFKMGIFGLDGGYSRIDLVCPFSI